MYKQAYLRGLRSALSKVGRSALSKVGQLAYRPLPSRPPAFQTAKDLGLKDIRNYAKPSVLQDAGTYTGNGVYASGSGTNAPAVRRQGRGYATQGGYGEVAPAPGSSYDPRGADYDPGSVGQLTQRVKTPVLGSPSGTQLLAKKKPASGVKTSMYKRSQVATTLAPAVQDYVSTRMGHSIPSPVVMALLGIPAGALAARKGKRLRGAVYGGIGGLGVGAGMIGGGGLGAVLGGVAGGGKALSNMPSESRNDAILNNDPALQMSTAKGMNTGMNIGAGLGGLGTGGLTVAALKGMSHKNDPWRDAEPGDEEEKDAEKQAYLRGMREALKSAQSIPEYLQLQNNQDFSIRNMFDHMRERMDNGLLPKLTNPEDVRYYAPSYPVKDIAANPDRNAIRNAIRAQRSAVMRKGVDALTPAAGKPGLMRSLFSGWVNRDNESKPTTAQPDPNAIPPKYKPSKEVTVPALPPATAPRNVAPAAATPPPRQTTPPPIVTIPAQYRSSGSGSGGGGGAPINIPKYDEETMWRIRNGARR